MYGHRICQNKRKLLSVDIKLFHDHKFSLYFVYVVRLAHVIELDDNAFASDGKYHAEGTISQSSFSINVTP